MLIDVHVSEALLLGLRSAPAFLLFAWLVWEWNPAMTGFPRSQWCTYGHSCCSSSITAVFWAQSTWTVSTVEVLLASAALSSLEVHPPVDGLLLSLCSRYPFSPAPVFRLEEMGGLIQSAPGSCSDAHL